MKAATLRMKSHRLLLRMKMPLMRVPRLLGLSCKTSFLLVLGAGIARGQTQPAPVYSVQVVDLSKKFLDFYEAAVRTSATPDERWKLWKEKYDYAGVPPIPAGQQMAREQLDAAWTRYPAALERIKRGAAALTPSPQERLSEVGALLGADRPVHIRLIAFVGAFHKNAFASGLKDGISTISIPLEDSDQDHALAMTHEFTHAVQMQLGSWSGQSVASQIFTEGLAMRATERLNPGLPPQNYTGGSTDWMEQCEARLPEVLSDLNQHLGDKGAEAVSRFTVGTGAAGLGREVYCAGWHLVGKLLQDGATFPALAHLTQDDADAKIAAVIKAVPKHCCALAACNLSDTNLRRFGYSSLRSRLIPLHSATMMPCTGGV